MEPWIVVNYFTDNSHRKIPKYCITDNATLQTLVIPHGVTTIIADAFSEATGLKRVYVPDVENFNTTPITNYSTSATIIRYTVTDENASPKRLKLLTRPYRTGHHQVQWKFTVMRWAIGM